MPTCFRCDRPASAIPSVVAFASENEQSPDDFARDDGTYNPITDHFACDECYIAIGMPSSPRGWKAP